MNKLEIILILIIVILAGSTGFFAFKYFSGQEQSDQSSAQCQVEAKVAFLNKLFVDKVLKTENEVSYEDRLLLENTVAELHDEQILQAWRQFLASKTEEEAQAGAKNLLSLLADKISK